LFEEMIQTRHDKEFHPLIVIWSEINIHHDRRSNGDGVEEKGSGPNHAIPELSLVRGPSFMPSVGKIYQQYNLYQQKYGSSLCELKLHNLATYSNFEIIKDV
jgi:hypothetical protein